MFFPRFFGKSRFAVVWEVRGNSFLASIGKGFVCRTPMINLDTEERHKQDVFHAISRYPIIMLFISI